MASSSSEDPLLDTVGVAVHKDAKDSFLYDVQGDYIHARGKHVRMNDVVLDLVKKNDILRGGSFADGIQEWVLEISDLELELPDEYTWDRDERTTIGLERRTRDSLGRKAKEMNFDEGPSEDWYTPTLAELCRVHKMILPIGLEWESIRDWKKDLELDSD